MTGYFKREKLFLPTLKSQQQGFFVFILFLFLFFCGAEDPTQSLALHLLGKSSSTELNPQPHIRSLNCDRRFDAAYL